MRAHSNLYLVAMLGLIGFLSFDCSKQPLAPKAARDESPTDAASALRHAPATEGHAGPLSQAFANSGRFMNATNRGSWRMPSKMGSTSRRFMSTSRSR